MFAFADLVGRISAYREERSFKEEALATEIKALNDAW